MKILFLDVDGVLNTHDRGGIYTLTKSKLRLLEHVVRSTDCKIVLSSTWRLFHHAQVKLKRALAYRGITIYSTTTVDIFKNKQCRGDEIELWLSTCSDDITAYAIVDDDNDMLPNQQSRFVQTNGLVGLTSEHCEKLITLLNNQGV